MNIRLVLFSGIISALIGAGVGWGVASIERNPSSFIYKSRYGYQDVYRRYLVLAGAGIGFVIGAGLQCVRELKTEEDEDNNP